MGSADFAYQAQDGWVKRPDAWDMSGEPFNRCTHSAMSPQGDLYISDGYGNARVHKYSPDGNLLFSWGGPGTGPGQFTSPHGMAVDSHGELYVGEVAYVSFSRSFPDIPKPARIRCLQKLVKVTAGIKTQE